jgi:hypothetical protein
LPIALGRRPRIAAVLGGIGRADGKSPLPGSPRKEGFERRGHAVRPNAIAGLAYATPKELVEEVKRLLK